jgi:small redox-active disulfide protein 2
MTITIYGAGCAKCKQMEELIRRVVAELGVDAEVVKVSGLMGIISAGILQTPAAAVDGVVKVAGRVPTVEEVTRWMTGN